MGYAVFACSFAVLVAFLAPGLYLRDSGELTTAAFSLGVAHETGFSLYCLLGKAAALLPLGEVAFRLNLLSAATGALAVWAVYRTVRAAAGDDAVARASGAVAGAILLCGLTFFRSATVAEVYAPTAAALALGLLLVDRAGQGDRSCALGLALLGGLSLGLHAQLRLLLGPPCLVWALWRLRRGDRWPLFAPAAVALGAMVVAYLPLRAARAPVADWADPRTLSAVLDHLSAARIRRAFADQILTRDWAVLGHHLRVFAGQVEGQLGVPVLVAALGGLAWLLSSPRARLLGVMLSAVLLGDVLYSIWINPMGLDDLQDGVPTALALAVAAGAGVQAAARRLASARAPGSRTGSLPVLGAAALGVLLCVPAALAEVDGKRGPGPEAAAWTGAALAGPAPRALVLTTSDDVAAGALYEQAVAGARPDLTVLVRQQLWDGPEVAARLRRGGGEVIDPFHGRAEKERIAHEADLLRAIVRAELPRREIAWEPGPDAPPVPVLPDVPLYRLAATPPPLPAARPLAARLEALLEPGRDPMVRRLCAGALSSLGRVYLEREDVPRAAALFEAALAIRPADAAAATNLAVVRARRGEYAGAAALVDEVLRRDPERLVARLNSGRYRLALGDLDGAAAQFSQVHARAPEDPAPLVGLARVAKQRNDTALALRLLKEAQRVAPADAEVRALREELK